MSFQTLFMQSKGQPINYQGRELKMIDRIKLKSNETRLKVSFISTESKWKQGIIFETKGHFAFNDKNYPTKIVIWEDTAPSITKFLIKSKNKELIIYNVWETEDGTIHYWYKGGAMYIEEKNGITTYNCNDGYDDDDLNDLIFSVEYY